MLTDFTGRKDEIVGVVAQADGKIVALGESWVYPQDKPRFGLVRYNADGSLDARFGDGGTVVTDFQQGEDWVSALALRPDGKILVAGVALAGQVFCTGTDGVTRGCDKFGFALVQYGPNGKPDKKFGDGGTALYEFDRTAGAAALALQSDGKIVLAGHYDYDDFAVVRANADGALDPTFGTGGLVRTPFSRSMDAASAVALQSDGAIIAAGSATLDTYADPLNDDFALTRYSGR